VLRHEPAPDAPGLMFSALPLAELQSTDQGRSWGFRWAAEDGRKLWLRRRPDDLRAVRVMLNSGTRLVIADRQGRLHRVTQRHTIRGTYQLQFTPAPVPTAPDRQSISTANSGSLT
jgi:hypothetical protein